MSCRAARRSALAALCLWPLQAGFVQAQPAGAARAPAGIAAARTSMAGAPLLASWRGSRPEGELAFALALPEAPAGLFVAGALAPLRESAVTLAVPGKAGPYELRLLRRDAAGTVSVVASQPLVATPPEATLAGPAVVRRGASFPARGNGPNGERDLVTLVEPDAPAETAGPGFLPADSIEGQIEAPPRPGVFELRYVMIAPLTGAVILARQPVRVE